VAVVVATAAAVVATAVAVVATVADMAETIKIEKSGSLWPQNERYDTTGKTKRNTFLHDKQHIEIKKTHCKILGNILKISVHILTSCS